MKGHGDGKQKIEEATMHRVKPLPSLLKFHTDVGFGILDGDGFEAT